MSGYEGIPGYSGNHRHENVRKLQKALEEWTGNKQWNLEKSGGKEKLGQWEQQLEEQMQQLEQQLWNTLLVFQGYPFYTWRGLEFTYRICGNELFVTRKEKSITRSTIRIAFQKALELKGIVSGPKKLGTFGASYLYPVFMQIGVIQKDEKTRK